MSQVHVRYEGHSYDLTFEALDVGGLSTDAEIRNAIANHLQAPVAKLNNFKVDRNAETGDITVRPEAVFG